jgi:hypothetical protein
LWQRRQQLQLRKSLRGWLLRYVQLRVLRLRKSLRGWLPRYVQLRVLRLRQLLRGWLQILQLRLQV